MIRAPISYRKRQWPKETHDRILEIERKFHVQEFGEELARVNLEMTIEQRHKYLDQMRELARQRGVPPPKGPFDHLESEA